MNSEPPVPENEANLSGLGRALLETGGSKPSGPWVPPTAEELGRLLPDYEILKMLGRGGMGAVYMGRQKSLDRPVAIKILSTALEDADPSFAERFKNEARAMGKLSHPGIVAVYDFGETEGGLLYIVMEYVEGTDVSRMIASEGRLHTEHAMAITAHVCDALAYAHQRGIIHRDIKPANIMVGYDGVVKVADFGLAKMSKAGETGLTQSGMVMGTLHYMAPEALVLGSGVDQRADIYAVGVMLYQMLTGKIPQGMFELPSLQIKGLDPRYDAIIAKALREDREVRYQSARELRGDLDNILTQPVAKVEAEAKKAPAALPTQERPQRPAGQPYRPPQAKRQPQPATRSSSSWVVWVVVVLSGLVGAYWLVKKRALPPDMVPGSIELASQETNPSAVVPAATKDVPFVNSLGMKFVPVPGTDVLFCIHETRYKDYAAYAAEAQGVDSAWKDQTADGYTPTENKEQHPVMKVSWEDAQKFCAWLSQKEGKTYRLPTDREWSMAVGIGHSEKWDAATTPSTVFKDPDEFPWGTQWPLPKGSGNFSDESHKAKAPHGDAQYIDGYDDGFPTTAPVMRFSPNKLGIYDLGGNVWEWCEDWYDNTQKDCVLRGGAWGNGVRGNLMSSYRGHYPPGHRHFNHGFRLVLAVSSDSVSVVSDTLSKPLPTEPSVQSASATKEQPFENTLGMKFVPVPGTEVLFCIHETRYKDYAAYAAENPTVNNAWKNQTNDGYVITDRNEDHPVTQVSWEDAKTFCTWLSKKEGKTYRLPTDAEWSIAVGLGNLEKRSPNTTPAMLSGKESSVFPWGGPFPPTIKGQAGNQSDVTRKARAPHPSSRYLDDYDDGFPTTAPVMSFKPNPIGLYDLEGNVREWVEDWWDELKAERVLRGGCFNGFSRIHMLSSVREHYSPDYRIGAYGFRVVLVPEAESKATLSDQPSPQTATASSTSPAKATQAQPFVNTLGMKFVPVPGTKVLFCIHETRRQDYAAYSADSAGVNDAWKNQQRHGIPCGDKDDHPVCGMNWEDAKKFCDWLSQKEGASYRLPTDNEWSIAVGVSGMEARTPSATPEQLAAIEHDHFPWGSEPPLKSSDKPGNYQDIGWKDISVGIPAIINYRDGFLTSAPVMSFRPNAFGLYDLGGNVWEWVVDPWNAEQKERVLRGGSFLDYERSRLRSSSRPHHPPGHRSPAFGFRVVLELP